jgi:hypothetical protein
LLNAQKTGRQLSGGHERLRVEHESSGRVLEREADRPGKAEVGSFHRAEVASCGKHAIEVGKERWSWTFNMDADALAESTLHRGQNFVEDHKYRMMALISDDFPRNSILELVHISFIGKPVRVCTGFLKWFAQFSPFGCRRRDAHFLR